MSEPASNELNPNTPTTPHKNSALLPLWSAIVVLAAAIVCGAWYVHRSIATMPASAAQPAATQASVDGLQARLNAEAANLKDWSRQSGALDARITKLEHGRRTHVSLTKRQTAKLVNQIQSKVDGAIGNLTSQETSKLDARLTAVETTERMQVTRLERELAQARRQLADLRSGDTRNVSLLTQKEQQDAKMIAAMRKPGDTRVDFDAARNHGKDLEPGISLYVQSTDPGFQHYSGYVFLLQDRSTIFFKNQDAQVPLMIYPKSGGEPMQLVAQHIARHDVTGYLLVPPSEMAYVRGEAFATAMPGGAR